MSFSSDVKNEIARGEEKKRCCMSAEIAGFLRMCGEITISEEGRRKLTISTENPAAARLFLKRIKKYFGVAVSLKIEQSNVLKKNRIYTLVIEDDNNVEDIISQIDEKLQNITKRRCCKKAFLRGAFLGSGTINHPEKGYHMEIVCRDQTQGDYIKELINSFGLAAKVAKRRNSFVIYLKESEQISDFLALLGANNQVLKFENVRIIKELRNKTNRIVNCESANLDKTIESAVRQIETIRFIESKNGLDKLPEKLYELAELRLENPGSSLSELGQLLQPPIKKSGVNHRFRKIEEIADKLR